MVQASMGPSDSDMSKKWAVPDSRFEVKNDPTCTKTDSSTCALSREKTEYGERGQRNSHAATWPSISRDGRQAAAQSKHQCQRPGGVLFHATEQEKKCIAKAEIKNSYLKQKRGWYGGSTFFVIGKAQILCFARLYTGGSDRLKFLFSF